MPLSLLQDASDTLYLPDILGVKVGITALAEFLEKSGAFTKSGAPKWNASTIEDTLLDHFRGEDQEDQG
ncbi:hypothetical protein P691DRAFT_685759 [Macrolepiota fuliginosa MF-IS2]|uniref:Uncharacterized protein n=1 Tax=Macrolepiota fuliginosa MF-IS2 TaxID=1400762 RepID=A0A9P5WXZ5_9AGAR|nr:hypothetical protein P691DRAFT_685759 [Macrolepiota fuliginosa MF-IS2]